MKWIRFCSAVVATLSLTAVAHADILNLFEGDCHLGAGKSCGCASECQPQCCKPTITRPCETSVHTYQRKISDLKKPCCCKPTCCAPAPKCCAPAPSCGCSAPAATCSAPAASCGCSAQANTCGCGGNSCGCSNSHHGLFSGHGGLFSGHGGLFSGKSCLMDGLSKMWGGNDCCCQVKCCDADPCEIAELIYKSQTACYARQRERAIEKLGNNYDCVCNPEIMTAMVYALNDADERVRKQAADEIGDQLRKNPCCCSDCVTAALKTALADCDRGVRRQAEEALEACGYCIVDGCCCETTCNSCGAPASSCGCGGSAAPAESAEPTPMPADEAAPAPAPPEDPKAYFPSRLRLEQTQTPTRRNGLAGLFGFLD